MNIQQIEYILAVAEIKNFGKAADRCHVTQSTLSTMVARYEQEIGVQVFDRRTKPVSITQEGYLLIDQMKTISREIALLNEKVQSIKGDWSGELKIGVIPTIAPFILPLFLNDFTKKFPKMNFHVSEITTETIIDLLSNRELDIGILAIPLAENALIEIPLYEEPFVLFDHSCIQQNNEVSMDEIDYSNFWLLAEGHCLHTQVRRICDQNYCERDKALNFDFKAGSIDSLIRFVKLNKGVTLLPQLATIGMHLEDIKCIKSIEEPVPVRKIGLITHKHFVKKKVLLELKLEIITKIIPLLNDNMSTKKLVNPY